MKPHLSTKSELLATLSEHGDRLRAWGVCRLGVFGSFVRDHPRPDSDVDLLVAFEPGAKTFDHFMAVCFFLEDLLGRRVELVTPESLSPHLGPHILEEVEYVPLAA